MAPELSQAQAVSSPESDSCKTETVRWGSVSVVNEDLLFVTLAGQHEVTCEPGCESWHVLV